MALSWWGWLLFGVGAAILLFTGIIGLDTGFGGIRAGNLPGLLVGMALMISGSVFAAVGILIEKISPLSAFTQKEESEELPKELPYRISEQDKFVEEYKSVKIFSVGNLLGTYYFLFDQAYYRHTSLSDAKLQIDTLTTPDTDVKNL